LSNHDDAITSVRVEHGEPTKADHGIMRHLKEALVRIVAIAFYGRCAVLVLLDAALMVRDADGHCRPATAEWILAAACPSNAPRGSRTI
jgi:hypothetical protein